MRFYRFRAEQRRRRSFGGWERGRARGAAGRVGAIRFGGSSRSPPTPPETPRPPDRAGAPRPVLPHPSDSTPPSAAPWSRRPSPSIAPHLCVWSDRGWWTARPGGGPSGILLAGSRASLCPPAPVKAPSNSGKQEQVNPASFYRRSPDVPSRGLPVLPVPGRHPVRQSWRPTPLQQLPPKLLRPSSPENAPRH